MVGRAGDSWPSLAATAVGRKCTIPPGFAPRRKAGSGRQGTGGIVLGPAAAEYTSLLSSEEDLFPSALDRRFSRFYGSCRDFGLLRRGVQEEEEPERDRRLSSMGGIMTRPEVKPFRTIKILREGVSADEEQCLMANNSVVTSKYNLITFVPRSLFEQFRRIANVYFLVISVLMMLGTYTELFSSPLKPFSTIVPLVLVLMVTMFKDGAEDLKRHRSDKRVSEREAVFFGKAFYFWYKK